MNGEPGTKQNPMTAPSPAHETEGEHWSAVVAREVVARSSDQSLYTCAAGISPSGIVHFGNFRDVMTAFAVVKELQLQGHEARLLFSWDDFDRFRKVPEGIDPSFNRYVGHPLSAIPDPRGEFPSYARRFQQEFERAMEALALPIEYRYQTEEYRSGRYDGQIALALEKREEIADILLSFMSDKSKEGKGLEPEEYRRSYFPISVYSRYSGSDRCKVLRHLGSSTIEYLCLDSGKTDVVDFTQDHIVKLAWKVDWPMRWGIEKVAFEPGGADHAAAGGSFSVASVIAEQIFGTPPPVFQGYAFIGLRGISSKMSGSKGGSVSPAVLLNIFEPELLKWLYLRRSPLQGFELAFDSEVYRQYDEFDRECAALRSGLVTPISRKVLGFCGVDDGISNLPPIPFRQAVALGQIVQWDLEKLGQVLEISRMSYDERSIVTRLQKARTWLEVYNPGEAIRFLDTPNRDYAATLDPPARGHVQRLRALLQDQGPPAAPDQLEAALYAIPIEPTLSAQQVKAAQREFFKTVYNLLIGRDTGPRLSTFLWASDRERVLGLLEIDEPGAQPIG